MPDVWEIDNGLNSLDASDAMLDPDGDGCDNLCEYLNNTDPQVYNVIPINLVGFDGQYKIFGKANSTDLFISRDDSDGNNGGVAGFYLRTNFGAGTQFYDLESPVTESEAGSEGFDVGNPLVFEIHLADFNYDGTTDAQIEGLEGVSVPGRMDTVIYSRPTSGSSPLGYKEIDQEFEDFYFELNSWLVDPDYFSDNALEVVSSDQYFGFFLSGESISADTLFACGIFEYFNEVPGIESDVTTDPIAETYRIPNGFDTANATGIHLFCFDTVTDYSVFSQDALAVATSSLGNYLTDGSPNPSGISGIWQILSELLAIVHGMNDEPEIINNVKVIAQILFGIGVPQDLPNYTNLNRVELLFTDVGWPGLPPLARHAYVLITTPAGDKYVTRGGPEAPPSYGLFGNLNTQADLNPMSDANFEDFGKTILFRQLVVYTPDTPSQIFNLFSQYTAATDSANIEYKLLTQNSNSYAFQVAKRLKGVRPKSIPWAPGWTKILTAF